MKGFNYDWLIIFALVGTLLLIAFTIAPDAECGDYDCSGFLCVVHADCPDTCFCAKEPWAPQGRCM